MDNFINHQMDPILMKSIGVEFVRRFASTSINKIITVEASGIIFAMTTALAMGDLPVIIAKKGQRRNLGDDVYTNRLK